MKANQKQWQLVKEQLNPSGSNFKDVNYINVLKNDKQGFEAQIGYWITYLGCKPKYNKEICFFSYKKGVKNANSN